MRLRNRRTAIVMTVVLLTTLACGANDRVNSNTSTAGNVQLVVRSTTSEAPAPPVETTQVDLVPLDSADALSNPVGVVGGTPLGTAAPPQIAAPSSSGNRYTPQPRSPSAPVAVAPSQPAAIPVPSPTTIPIGAQDDEPGAEPSDEDSDNPGEQVDPADASTPVPPPAIAFSDGIELAADRAPSKPLALVDDLSEQDSWRLYEQVIPFRPECYGTGLASAVISEIDGAPALSLTANHAGSNMSNHALLGRFVTAAPVDFGPQQLRVAAMVTGDSMGQTQTGPEMSLQMTARASDGRHLTAVFGLQYVAASGTWQVLTGGSTLGAWSAVATATIEPDVWYDIVLDIDTLTNTYQRLTVSGPNGFTVEPDGLATIWEEKGVATEATWVTLNAENLFTCDEPEIAITTLRYRNLSLSTLGG